jgi:hypothetical protein
MSKHVRCLASGCIVLLAEHDGLAAAGSNLLVQAVFLDSSRKQRQVPATSPAAQEDGVFRRFYWW